MERLLGIFKDKHVSEQCNIAKSLVRPTIDTNKIEDIIEKHSIIHDVLHENDGMAIVEKNVYHDVEFLEEGKVFDNIHNCTLKGGRLLSKSIYSHPIMSNDILAQRRNALETLEKVLCLNNEKVNCTLEKLKDSEPYIVWLFEEHESNLDDLYNIVFFKWKGLNWLNNSGEALTTWNLYRILVSPMVGILSPIIYFLVPYLVLVFKFKIRVSFTFYLRTLANGLWTMNTALGKSHVLGYARIISYLFSAVFYFQSIFSSVEVSKICNKISGFLVGNLNQSIVFMQSALELRDMCWNESMKGYFNVKDSTNDHDFIRKLKIKDFGLFGNFGAQLRDYKQLIGSKLNSVKIVLQNAYMLDALIGAVRYKRQYSLCYNMPQRTEAGSPIVKLDNMKHPALPFEKAVSNNVYLGAGAEGHNAIITSPNSSGKSVLIKSVVVNILMAQTMGICCATESSISPFGYINTQINVPDSTGCESLFEAEMHRCKYNLDTLAKLHFASNKFNKPSLIVMDEIFSSTNPVEAVAGAFAVCRKMAQYQNNILIFTTHFNYLTKLAKDKDLRFINYRMGTQHDEEQGKITFDYKLERGVNKHLLALELLKKTGFDADIIDEAIKIKKHLSTAKTGK